MRPEYGKIGDIDIAVGDDEEFGQGQLPFAEDPQAAGKGLTRIAIGDPGGGQTVKTGFAEGLQLLHPFHDQGKERGEQVLEKIADKKILLPGSADNGGRIDGLVAVIEMADLEDRIVMLQGVVAVMVAKGAFRSPHMRRHHALDGKFDIGHQAVAAARVLGHLQFLAQQQGGEHQFRDILRQRGDGRRASGPAGRRYRGSAAAAGCCFSASK